MSSNVLYGIQLHPCGQICYFSAGSWPDLNVGAKIVVRIDRGEALGQVVKLMTANNHNNETNPTPTENNFVQKQSDPQMDSSTVSSIELKNDASLESSCTNADTEDSNDFLEQETETDLPSNKLSATSNPPSTAPSSAPLKEKKTVFAGEVYQWDNWEEESGPNEDQTDDSSEPSLCLDPYAENISPILRPASELDINQAKSNAEAGLAARRFCANRARQHKLDMKMVMADYLLDGSKIIFYFTAPNRIDFRELVKDLVKEFRTRIELRQIGVRHETQMIGATGNCGMVCCCRRYMRKFDPVTIKMAKEQNLFLNPTKISGTCGRLLCCLAFEQEGYEEFHSLCPKMGKKYNTNRGSVKVLRSSIFRNSLTLLPEEGDEYEVQLDEWQEMEATRQGHTPPPPNNSRQETNKETPERASRPDRTERQERGKRSGRQERPEQAEKMEKAGKSDVSTHVGESNNQEAKSWHEKNNRSYPPNKTDRSEKVYSSNRPAKPEKADRNRQFTDKEPRNTRLEPKANYLPQAEATSLGDRRTGQAQLDNRIENTPEKNSVQEPKIFEQRDNAEKYSNPASKKNQTEIKNPANFAQNTGLSRFLATTAGDDEDE